MDKGTAFVNVLMKTYLVNNNIKLFATHSERKSQIVERLNRTIKGIIFRYFKKKNTRTYIDILQDIPSKYNASYHRSIKLTSKDVHKDKETQVWINLYEKRLSHKEGTEKAPFMKRYQAIWIEEVLVIHAIVYGNPTTYKIKDQDNEPIKGTFYEQELQLNSHVFEDETES